MTSVLPVPIYRGSAQRTDLMIRMLKKLNLDVTLCILNQSFQDHRSDEIEQALKQHYGLREVVVRRHPRFQGGHEKLVWWRRLLTDPFWLYRLLTTMDGWAGGRLRAFNLADCPLNLRRTLAKLYARRHYDIVWVNYAKLLPAVPRRAYPRVIVDTHDVQTRLFELEKLKQYKAFLRPLFRRIFWWSECRLLRRARTIVAINPGEAELLRRASPKSRVFTIPAIIDGVVIPGIQPSRVHDLLFIGSASQANIEGLSFFLSQILPALHAAQPGITLLIVGRIGTHATIAKHSVLRQYRASGAIHCLPHVQDIASSYRQGRIVIAPILGGAGMKIKVVEAFAHGKCVVGTPLAFDGINMGDRECAVVCHTAEEFIRRILDILGSPENRKAIEADARRLFEREHSVPVGLALLRDALGPRMPQLPSSLGVPRERADFHLTRFPLDWSHEGAGHVAL